MSDVFVKKREICIISELLKHFLAEWKDLYDEAIDVVECIDFALKDEIIAIRWGGDFNSSDDELNGEDANLVASLCEMISFEDY